MTPTLRINEVFYSIQGESTRAGLPCVFIRLTGCHLRCNYCDTEYAFHEGDRGTIDDVLGEAERISGGCDLVEITGGEPLLQPAVHPLMTRLCDAGKTVLLETSGACDISACDPRVIRIMDLKTPGSGEAHRNLWSNLEHLTPRDEVKFVLCDRFDYEWACDAIRKYDLPGRVNAVLMSAAAAMPPGREIAGVSGLSMRDLAEWVLADRLPVRLQTQLHKLIWDPMARGV
jgi:7-carboxy-7-deazaguanine synthase